MPCGIESEVRGLDSGANMAIHPFNHHRALELTYEIRFVWQVGNGP